MRISQPLFFRNNRECFETMSEEEINFVPMDNVLDGRFGECANLPMDVAVSAKPLGTTKHRSTHHSPDTRIRFFHLQAYKVSDRRQVHTPPHEGLHLHTWSVCSHSRVASTLAWSKRHKGYTLYKGVWHRRTPWLLGRSSNQPGDILWYRIPRVHSAGCRTGPS
jgi:hypothetical protein